LGVNGVRFINKSVRGIAMTIKRRFVILLASMMAFGCASANAASGGDCLPYEPAQVTLKGKVSLKVFPGPPEYTSVKEGDKPEPAWLLRLAKPICVKADKKDEDNRAEDNVSVIHLVLRGKQFSQLRRLRKKGAVRFTGQLFHALTGHHHAEVLLRVTRMQAP
jgi:hypothetical protein